MFADVVAKPGRKAILERVQDLREYYRADIITMNAENVAGGFSITPPIAEEFFAHGIDIMTSGNHIFDKSEVVPYIKTQPLLLRPAIIRRERRAAGFLSARYAVLRWRF